MRASRLAIVLAIAAAPLISHAEIVSYTFSANVSTMFTADDSGIIDVNTSSLAGSPISMGDRLTGQITYDTSLAPGYTSEDGASVLYFGAIQSLSFKFDTTGLQYQSAGSFDITAVSVHPSGYGFSAVGFSTSNYAAPARTSGWLDFDDFSGKALNNLAIPSGLSLQAFPYSAATYIWEAPDHSVRLFATADLDTLTKVSAVPEPSSWSLFAIGAAVLAGLTRRQRRT